jgi:3D (Asp-Asp-Asp) domain-containing protein
MKFATYFLLIISVALSCSTYYYIEKSNSLKEQEKLLIQCFEEEHNEKLELYERYRNLKNEVCEKDDTIENLSDVVISNEQSIEVLNERVEHLESVVEKIQDGHSSNLKGTAYTPFGSIGNGVTASGTKASPGRTVAVSRDLKHWMHKYVYIKGIGIRKVEDLMPANRRNSIDVVVPDNLTAKEFGVKTLRVTVLGKEL